MAAHRFSTFIATVLSLTIIEDVLTANFNDRLQAAVLGRPMPRAEQSPACTTRPAATNRASPPPKARGHVSKGGGLDPLAAS